MNYRFSLEKYSGPGSRHTCPACGRKKEFTLYVDASGKPIGKEYGKCNRIEKCGYDKRPDSSSQPGERKYQRDICSYMMPDEMINTFRGQRAGSSFAKALLKRFSLEQVKQVLINYHAGNLNGNVVFWQVDELGEIRCGKVMSYKGLKRNGYTNWMHKVLKKDPYHLKQCLFGLHQIKGVPITSVITIVESEKTAIIGSIYHPEALFLATGGAQGLTKEKLKPLEGYKIEIYPDIGQEQNWENKVRGFPNCKVFHWAKMIRWVPNPIPVKQGDDLADLYLQFTVKRWEEIINGGKNIRTEPDKKECSKSEFSQPMEVAANGPF